MSRETDPRTPKITSSRIQVVPGNTNNRIYPFPAGTPVLLQLGNAARQYLIDEGVLPSQLQVCASSYEEVEPFLIPYGEEAKKDNPLHYWLDGNNPILVGVYGGIGAHKVKCIGTRTTGALPVIQQEHEQQSA
jgi:hypothetical protein